MKKLLPCFLLVFLAACSSLKGPLTIHNMETPPGTIRLGDNLYVDQTEITNFNWLEYMFYTARAYGKQSPQYLATLPDTNVWRNSSFGQDTLFTAVCADFYLRHPAYRNYPAVGISYEQACAFSKWRSDRVMEGFLVGKKMIKWTPTFHADTVFTIEKYFNGQYLGYQPSNKFRIYPVYSLPDSLQWERIHQKADSLNIIWLKKYGKKIKEPYPHIRSTDFGSLDVTGPVIRTRYAGKNIYWYTRGNVRELGLEKGISYGGSWKDSISVILENKSYPAQDPNAWTGFRNVCVWKKWK